MLYFPHHRDVVKEDEGGREERRKGKRGKEAKISKATGRIKLQCFT